MLATTRIAVIRGSEAHPMGFEVEGTDPVPSLADIPASLIERSRGVWDPSTETRRTVRTMTCRLPVATPHPATGESVAVQLEEGDRIRDNRTGIIYAVNEKTEVPRSLAGAAHLTLDLKATATAS